MVQRAATESSRGVPSELGTEDFHAGSSVHTYYEDTDVSGGAGFDDEFGDGLVPAVSSAEQLISAAIAAAGDDLETARLIARYWRFAPDEELVDREPQELLDAAVAHLELARQRLAGQLKLRVSAPGEDSRTVIDIVVDDMPFLVDSVTGAITARNLDVHLLVHPLVVVRRTPLGALQEAAAEVEPDDAIAGDLVESWIHLEIDPVRDSAELAALESELHQVLTDVRESVEDWPKMRAAALAIADELASVPRPPVPEKDISDSIALLRWLAADHFTFLGYREYELVEEPDPTESTGEPVTMLVATGGTGLGILRNDQTRPRVLSSMSPEAYAKVFERRLLIITKANSRATVHRNAYLDYIGLKMFDADGVVVGERRFIGLFTSSAYRSSVQDLPVVRRKVAEVLERSGLSPRSHSGKDLLEILESYPRDELFSISTDDLYRAVIGVLRMAGRRQLRVFLRKDHYGRFISCLIYLPRDRFTTSNRLKMQEILLAQLHGVGVDYTTRVTESLLARVHFIVRTDPAKPPAHVDPDALAERLAEATRLWYDDLALVLGRKLGDEQTKWLFTRYRDAFPESYKDHHTPHEAVKDLAKLELLEDSGQLEMHLFQRRGDDSVRFKIYRFGEPMSLSAVLPVLHSLGVRVTDEHPYEITRDDGIAYLYDFGLQLPPDARRPADVRGQVENAFSTAWRGEAEVDDFNALVLRAGLSWRQVVVLRAYAKYLRQAGTVFSQEYLQTTLCAYPKVAALLVAIFEARFDPWYDEAEQPRPQRVRELTAELESSLDEVHSLDQDRIIRSYLGLIQATVRTSFFQRGQHGRPKSYVALKLDPRALPELPQPRPRFEIFVYSPRFEGVHLRFGLVARGGLRWSDRRDDFRTEILGLVKAQEVKNAVIVPAGAKGGFVLKQPPADGEARRAEAVACYRQFISGLLDVTDNLVGGQAVPPPAVVRHDGDDPYLVVAADKGTATFSDLANEISRGYDFWLGDAFASGGSAGYDHKKMGITARGAWESVKRHFRELDLDIQQQPVTAVGVGDMSGDVFGNGMLLSRHLRLVAAFDHRHIFLDPEPDPATSYPERERLFRLPASSWDDYDRSLISTGGGVYSRHAKSIPVTPQVSAALGLIDPPTAMTPAELVRAILLAPVDLLWNGGIGTYVKASSESHGEVGDKTNDPVRVNGAQLRCRVIGEGGNLGLTQAGRVEYALAGVGGTGGRIYTDFIDNAGGVNCSDREVNIKILLAAADLPQPARDELLAEMTDEVAALVLRDNYDQAWALGRARAQAVPLLPVHRRMLSDLEESGALDRSLAAMPTDAEITARLAAGKGGLSTPELSVLMAYVKNLLKAEVADSELPDEAWTYDLLAGYFPTPLAERFGSQMRGHRLRREISSLVLVNEVVNRGGTSFVYRAVEETGASAADVLRAYIVVREVYGLPELWRAVEALDNQVPIAAQTAVYLATRRLLDRAVRWLLQNRRSPLDVAGEIAALQPGVARLLPQLGGLFRGVERDALRDSVTQYVAAGLPAELADWTGRLSYSFGLLDIVEVTKRGADTSEPESLDETAEVYFVLSERFRVDSILSKISSLPREDRWQTLARMALRYDLYAALAALTWEVLAATAPTAEPASRVFQWEQLNAASIARARNAIGEFGDAAADLAALSVLLRQIRTLVRTTAA
ncbi:NAD-glutamate dehydrogenase [Natronosporangium hydrolyticum]|uniref:NAD-glutamate dehydrogenase n=1 Tax=Natronosporangium hydrolyticum TaxID=2811111 RepID=A0A895YPB6_9ACTN|nr:NAD-glutamate dehydrogenase [Natronosporangium hydrolyticum]QSB15950.1 NAD-glutamate dehydrogenase [Natronosporangium hydrolyticum]